MTDQLRSLLPVGQHEDEAAREARHQMLATLLGAYADGELPLETASQIDAHLLGCGRCRSELHVQTAVRERMSRTTVPTATPSLQNRIRLGLAATPVPVRAAAAPTAVPRSGRQRVMVALAALAAVAASALLIVRERAPQLDPPPLVVNSGVPAIQSTLIEYRQVAQGDLPGRARDLEAVRRAVPFPVTPLVNPDAHLLAAWTTMLHGEPAAVLAYRWRDHVVLHFIVAEGALFRAHDVRTAFAQRRAVVSQDGEQGVIAWPDANAGSTLVGDLPWLDLVPLSRAHTK